MVPVFWTGLAVWLLFAVAPLRMVLGLVPRRRRWAGHGPLSGHNLHCVAAVLALFHSALTPPPCLPTRLAQHRHGGADLSGDPGRRAAVWPG